MRKKIHKVFYGSTVLLKTYCKNCKQDSFIIDGKLQCCNALLEDIYDKEVRKRESLGRHLRNIVSLNIKKEILKLQEDRCIYCDKGLYSHVWSEKKCKYIKIRIHFDHFVPWVYSQDSHKDNIYASCHICNLLKSDFHFHDLVSAREYINAKREKKGYV